MILCITYRKIINLYFNKKREAKSRNNISENSHLINNNDDDDNENENQDIYIPQNIIVIQRNIFAKLIGYI